MRILVDCCLTAGWVAVLEHAGHEAVHWRSIGAIDATDEQILDWAAVNGHIVLTHDLDFGALLASRKASVPSLVQVRAQSHLPKVVGAIVVGAIAQFADELAEGAIVTVDAVRAKVRMLPLT